MTRVTFLLIFIFSCFPAFAKLNLNPVHPDEDSDSTFTQRFSLQSSLKCLESMHSSLSSFRKLTEYSADKISAEKLEEIGNTGWETQNLGFDNWNSAVKGTLLKQDYLIKKLNYELAVEKLKSGNISKEEVAKREKAFKESEYTFQSYWDSFGISD